MMKAIVDEGELREWVEIRGGSPATIDGTQSHPDEPGELTVHFAGMNDDGVVDVDWERFFDKFERKHLALVYDDRRPEDEPTLDFRFTDRFRIKDGLAEMEREHGTHRR